MIGKTLFRTHGYSYISKSVQCRRVSSWIKQEKPSGDPLNILFCGSEEFSTFSLKALTEYSKSSNSNIESITVVTRKGKLAGRGLKTIKHPQIKHVADKLKLPLHQIDTFTGWSPPSDYHDLKSSSPVVNLVIAVDFGLLVPPRILQNATYGGLNIHPSLLPDLRGPAPLQWAILHGLDYGGVSLQTLHPSKFDEGVVLEQVRVPIPNPTAYTFHELRNLLAPIGGELLVNGLRKRLYIPPHKSVIEETVDQPRRYAPKIEPDHRAFDPERHNVQELFRMSRALGRVWSYAATTNGTNIRILLGTDLRRQGTYDLDLKMVDVAAAVPTGVPYGIVKQDQDPRNTKNPLMMNMSIGTGVTIPTITVSGAAPGPALAAAKKGGLVLGPITSNGFDLYTFHSPLQGPI